MLCTYVCIVWESRRVWVFFWRPSLWISHHLSDSWPPIEVHWLCCCCCCWCYHSIHTKISITHTAHIAINQLFYISATQLTSAQMRMQIMYYCVIYARLPPPTAPRLASTLGEPLVRVSVHLFHWQPTKISFKPTEVPLSFIWFWCRRPKYPFRQLAFVSSLAWPPCLCLFSTSLKWETMPTWNWCFHSVWNWKVAVWVRLQLFNFSPAEAERPVKLGGNPFMRSFYNVNSFYIVNNQKSCLAWMQCPPLCIEPQ